MPDAVWDDVRKVDVLWTGLNWGFGAGQERKF